MAQEMDKFMGTSEDEEEDIDMKDEDEEDEHHHHNHHHHQQQQQQQHYQESRNHPTTTTTDDTTGMMMMINTDEQGGGGGISSFQNLGSGGNHDHPLEEEDQEQNHNHNQMGSGGMRRCRPKEEKERTKLRERHRRAITARILAGLRRHGNYNLRVRADINDVIGALAREAGWVVLPDGTTFPSRSSSSSSQGAKCIGTSPPPLPPPNAAAAVAVNSSLQSPMASLQCGAPLSSVRGGISPGVVRSSVGLKSVYVPASLPYDATTNSGRSRSFVMAGGDGTDNSTLMGSCMDSMDDKQPLDTPQKLQERDFAGTPYVPVYVMLPLGVINKKCELVDPDGLLKQLRILKSVNVDGVMVDCWWGIVEADGPQEYKWYGYKRLFQLVRDLKLKLQVVMSFHECGGNVGDDVCIPLPHWVAEIGRTNADIFFTDKAGRRNSECLSWGIDKERVLRGRTAVEVYFDYMRSFRVEFDEFFEDGVISEIEIGLGPCGELRYPSYPVKHGWRYPGIGEFQCYDQYMMKSLTKAAEARGHSFWSKGPDNAGSYNVQPHDTGFFCDGGDYDSYYGRFFLNWYSQFLLDHADRVLSLAKLAFEGSNIAVKLSGIHWWYKTASHASELTAGFYNPCNRDGYAAIATVLKKHDAALNFTCVELRTLDQQEDFPEALADPEGLVWQVLNAAWDVSIPVASENALPCYDREGYNKILENAKPVNDPDGRHLIAFTYLRLSSILMERHNFVEFERFVKRMHGEAVLDLQMQ